MPGTDDDPGGSPATAPAASGFGVARAGVTGARGGTRRGAVAGGTAARTGGKDPAGRGWRTGGSAGSLRSALTGTAKPRLSKSAAVS